MPRVNHPPSPHRESFAREGSRLRVAALGHPRMLATSVTLPVEILTAAAQASPVRPRPRVTLQLLTGKGGPLETAEGLTLASLPLKNADLPDVLLLPAIWRHPRRALRQAEAQRDYVSRCVAGGSWVCCAGTGSYLLASTGLLDGRFATTHWQWFDDFAARFPRVKLRRDHLIAHSGRLFSVGSVNSIADLMVYLSSQLFSTAAATAIENQFSPEIRRRFSPSSLSGSVESHSDEQILDAQQQLRDSLASPPDLEQLAEKVGLSSRTLSRRFKQALGVTPGAYLHGLRMAEAQSLLQHSNLSVADVGWNVGFRDASLFSRRFRQHVGVSPRQWRQAVRGKVFGLVQSSDAVEPSDGLWLNRGP